MKYVLHTGSHRSSCAVRMRSVKQLVVKSPHQATLRQRQGWHFDVATCKHCIAKFKMCFCFDKVPRCRKMSQVSIFISRLFLSIQWVNVLDNLAMDLEPRFSFNLLTLEVRPWFCRCFPCNIKVLRSYDAMVWRCQMMQKQINKRLPIWTLK